MRRLRLLVTGTVVSIFAAFGVVPTAQAAVDYFLEIDGVEGESQDAKLFKSVEIEAFSWGASSGEKKVALQDLSVSKFVDLASPQLFQRLVQGTTIPSVELIGLTSGEVQTVFLRYCLQNVRVSSQSQSGNRGGDSARENVTFAYGSFTQQYTRLDAKGGAADTVFAGWNTTTGQLIGAYPANCGGV